MQSYTGSLKVAATADVLDAVFAVDDTQLRVVAGEEELGTWSLADISVENQGDGLYVNLGGEGVIVDVPDKEAFASAISPEAPRRRTRQRHKKTREPREQVSLADRLAWVPELFDRRNWERWLNDTTVRWAIASVAVIVFALLALFATNTLGMILILVGMVALIIAALAVSDDLSAYRVIPDALSETKLVIGGATAMIIGGLLVVIG